MSFDTLKKNRQSAINKLRDAAESASGGNYKNEDDDLKWKPTRDKAGNGHALIRFLPSPADSDLPWIQYWDHGFQGPTGKWLIEKSLSSLGKDCPISEFNSALWNSGNEEDKEQARKQKRRLHYVSNILVIDDPGNPDNNGKVFLYEYGKKIFDKIQDVMNPEFEDETAINPFDMWEGADFKLRIRKVEGWVNYDKSEFASPGAITEDEAKLEELYNSLHSLSTFVDPANYKTYEQLEKKLNDVMGITADPGKAAPAPEQREDPAPLDTNTVDESDDIPMESTESSESLSYFERLANE